ncbi:Spo0B domain-containing protein [Alkalicoccus chagannorensis]|uniref:Spo0B domain-containing protein n=1 Tax=Alkalicoccus chagannorensis TaxID=427072 RepID=UPI000401A929|nr:Spo0B domain-containing protein [Alkalicoccus chagannorensis]
MDDEQFIRMLSNYRHDVMNDIQLIKAYTSMGETDRIEHVITDMTQRAMHESRLSRMQAPRLARELLTYNWRSPVFPVHVEVAGEADWSDVEGLALQCIHRITTVLEGFTGRAGDSALDILLDNSRQRVMLIEASAEEGLTQTASLLPDVVEQTSSYVCIRVNLDSPETRAKWK